MLPEIAVEVVRFLSRRDLDKASGASKQLDALIAQCCAVYPLRPLSQIRLYPCVSTLKVWLANDADVSTFRSFSSLDEALHFAGALLRHSYVGFLQVGDYNSRGTRVGLLPDHWTTLIDAVRSGALRSLLFHGVDFSALGDDSFVDAVGLPGLKSFMVHRSVFPSHLVADDLIRSSIAKGVLQLSFLDNESDAPHTLSDDAVLDFFFPADAAPARQPLSLILEGDGVTDMFLARLFGRLQASPTRPSASLKFRGDVPKQRGLSAYDRYLASDGTRGVAATYRFPSMDDDSKSYEVQLSEAPIYLYIDCHAPQ